MWRPSAIRSSASSAKTPLPDGPLALSKPGLALTVALDFSILGMAFHTVREFGWTGLADPGSGYLPVVAIQLGLLAWWWLAPLSRLTAARWLGITGWIQLIGGAILSVLPLPFLPYSPEQSVGHYVSHLVFGICQVPLILIARGAVVAATPVRYP